MVIIIYNLVVIGIEKYFLLRRVLWILSVIVVCKLIFFVWFVGFVGVLFFVMIFIGIRYDLNEIYFIVICKYDIEYLFV